MKKLLKAIIAMGLFLWLIPMIWGGITKDRSIPYKAQNPVANDKVLQELKKQKDIQYVLDSENNIYIGSIAIVEKNQFNIPLVTFYVCGVIKKYGSDFDTVHIVDINQIAFHNKSPQEAEIEKFRCSDYTVLDKK